MLMYEAFVNTYEFVIFATDVDNGLIYHMIGLEHRPEADEVNSLVKELETDEELNMTDKMYGVDYHFVLFEVKDVEDVIKVLLSETDYKIKYSS